MTVRVAGVLAVQASLITASVTACSDSGRVASGRVDTVIDTLDGIVNVRNSGVAPEWTLKPVLRLGTIEGGPDEFARIRSLAVDPDGSIYVAENMANEIRVFSPSGQHVRTIGRSGGGPGEFGDLYSLAWLGDNLAAMDPRNARIAILSRQGEWIESIRHYPISGSPLMVRFHPLNNRGFYTPIIDAQKSGIPFVRITAEGPADTMIIPRPPTNAAPTGVTCHRPDGGIWGMSIPDGPAMVYAFPQPGGRMAISWTESYRIAFVSATDDTLRVVMRDQDPVEYTDSLWGVFTEPLREMHDNFPGMRCVPATPDRPRARAALRHIMFDEAGRMWVEAASEQGYVWDVFDVDGRLLGSAPAPPRTTSVPPYARDDQLYQVETDDLDVQYVGVYRLNGLLQ